MCRCDNDQQAITNSPVYEFINKALWVFAVLLPIFMIENLPEFWNAREKEEIQGAMQVAAESNRYCERWGMAPTTPEHTNCLRDLITIRINTEQRLHEREESVF